MKTLLISPNSLNLSSCMTRYMYDKLVEAAPVNKPKFLDKGDVMHLMLAEYYREKMKPAGERPSHHDMIEKAIEEGRRKVITLDIDVVESEDEVISTFRDYCLFWQQDNYIPIAVEQEIITTLYERPDSDEGEGLRVLMQLIVDIIFENSQGRKIWTDHKTRSRNFEPIPLSNQFMAYAFFSGTSLSMRNNIGFQKSLPPEKKFTRDLFPYPKEVLEHWRMWSVYRAEMIDRCIKEGEFPPDFTKCSEFSGCWFVDVCMQPPEERQRFLNENFLRRKRKANILELKEEKEEKENGHN